MPIDDDQCLDYVPTPQTAPTERVELPSSHSFLAAITAHQDRIQPLWDDAFHGPIVQDYKPGDVVWMYDHYNTAVIHERTLPGRWLITTSDADGEVHEYEYEAKWLRPAKEPVVFRWYALKVDE